LPWFRGTLFALYSLPVRRFRGVLPAVSYSPLRRGIRLMPCLHLRGAGRFAELEGFSTKTLPFAAVSSKSWARRDPAAPTALPATEAPYPWSGNSVLLPIDECLCLWSSVAQYCLFFVAQLVTGTSGFGDNRTASSKGSVRQISARREVVLFPGQGGSELGHAALVATHRNAACERRYRDRCRQNSAGGFRALHLGFSGNFRKFSVIPKT